MASCRMEGATCDQRTQAVFSVLASTMEYTECFFFLFLLFFPNTSTCSEEDAHIANPSNQRTTDATPG